MKTTPALSVSGTESPLQPLTQEDFLALVTWECKLLSTKLRNRLRFLGEDSEIATFKTFQGMLDYDKRFDGGLWRFVGIGKKHYSTLVEVFNSHGLTLAAWRRL